MMNLRLKYLALFVILVLIEIFIAIFAHDNIIRPYVGDILVVFVIYTAIRVVFPTQIKFLPLYVFIFALSVELLQLMNIVQILGLENNRFMSILIGSVFDIKDIVCYGIGCILLMFLNRQIEK